MVKILLVEDDFISALLMQQNLELEGYDVCDTAGTGPEAIERAEQDRPDFVLTDVRLAGEMSGIEAAREIHNRFQIPIIFVTGFSDDETLAAARALNPLAILTKPVTPADVIPVIDAALGTKNK